MLQKRVEKHVTEWRIEWHSGETSVVESQGELHVWYLHTLRPLSTLAHPMRHPVFLMLLSYQQGNGPVAACVRPSLKLCRLLILVSFKSQLKKKTEEFQISISFLTYLGPRPQKKSVSPCWQISKFSRVRVGIYSISLFLKYYSNHRNGSLMKSYNINFVKWNAQA